MLRLLALALGPLLPSLAGAQDYPQRKAGLWEVAMTMQQGTPPQVVQQCIDANTDRQLMEHFGGMTKRDCAKNISRREGAGYVIESDCTIGGMKVVSKGTLTGDFNAAYTMRMESTVNGKPTAMTMNAKYLGACRPGQKPGDMVMNGMTINLNALPKGN